jgi:hypothetical protein
VQSVDLVTNKWIHLFTVQVFSYGTHRAAKRGTDGSDGKSFGVANFSKLFTQLLGGGVKL